jgi:hypothetical protein
MRTTGCDFQRPLHILLTLHIKEVNIIIIDVGEKIIPRSALAVPKSNLSFQAICLNFI